MNDRPIKPFYPVDSPYPNDSLEFWQFCLGWILLAVILFGLGFYLWGPYEDSTDYIQNCHELGYTWSQCYEFHQRGVELPER